MDLVEEHDRYGLREKVERESKSWKESAGREETKEAIDKLQSLIELLSTALVSLRQQ